MWHHIFFKPAPCATNLRLMLRCASVGMYLTAACAMARLGASWLAHNGLRCVVASGALPLTALCGAVSTSSLSRLRLPCA